MQPNQRPNNYIQYNPTQTGSVDGIMQGPLSNPQLESLEPDAHGPPPAAEVVVVYKRQTWQKIVMVVGFCILLALIISALTFIFIRRSRRAAPVHLGSFETVRLPLGLVAKSDATPLSAPTVSINGQLVVNKSVVITPSIRPATPTSGEIYYDQDANQLLLYNGTDFVNLGSSIQTTTNVTNILGGTTTIVAGPGGGTQLVATNGTPGALPKFTGAQSIGPSIVTDNGNSVSIGGNVNLVTPAAGPLPDLQVWPDNPTPVDEVASPDPVAVEVGVKIHADVSGLVKGVRFYKGTTNVGVHTGHLWNTSGNLLASVTFTNETATGWQEARFATPVAISAETTYIVSYHAPVGHYAFDNNYFSLNDHSNDVLHASRDGEDGANGVFRYGATPVFPSTGFNGANYWVDVVFQPNPPPSRYQVNGAQLSSTDLANNGDLAKRGASQVFTGNNTFRSSVSSGVAFSVQDSNGLPLFQADAQTDRLYVGPTLGDAGGVILVLGNRTVGGDPAGAEGAIYYNRERHMFRCYRGAVWGACADLEVESGFSMYDEFMGGQVAGFGTDGIIGSLGWNTQAIGANGSISFNPTTPAPSADRPGVLALQTPGVANQGTTLMLGSASAPSTLIQTGNTVKTSVALGAATGQVARIGLHTQTSGTAQPVSGVWWEANPVTDARWRFCYGNGTTATCAPSSVNIVADAWVRLEIRVLATGAGTSVVDFGLNGTFYTVSNVTVDTTSRLSPAYSCFTTVATAQNCYWDYFQFRGGTSVDR
jgi:hypothetical protein